MVQTKNLTFQYNRKQDSFHFPDIDLKGQENLLILGKSGIGKTTLLHLLAGLLRANEGSVSIDNTTINRLSNSQLDQFRGQQIGLVFQQNHAIQALSVLENLKARVFFSKKKASTAKMEDLLTELDLIELKNRKINKLSEGQLQRLGIALAVIHNPKVILADEPTSSLDDENCKNVIELLQKQAANNKANLIVITHDQRIKPFFQHSIKL